MKYLLLLAFIFVNGISFADSPLTSTPFSNAYKEEKMVKHISENGLDKKSLKFLSKKNASPVVKIAMVNALSWGNKDLVHIYENYLLTKRKGLKPEVFDYLRVVSDEIPKENTQTNLLTADDLMCWAYFQTLGDYFNPNMGGRAAYLAYVREPESMAHSTVFTLIACQIAFDSNWCNVYKLGQEFLVDTRYTKNTLNDAALKIILDYLNLYRGDCKE